MVSRRTFTRSACTWKSAQVLQFFSKILIHMHNLKMCSGSSSSGRLTVASIAFNLNLMLRCAYHLSPPCPPNFNVGSSCFSCAAALAFGTCAQPTNSSACGGVSRAISLFNNVVASARAVPARVEAVQLEHVVSGSCLLAASSRRNIEMGGSGGGSKNECKFENWKLQDCNID